MARADHSRPLSRTARNLFAVFVEPSAIDAAMLDQMTWWCPLLVLAALQTPVTLAWVYSTDPFSAVIGTAEFPVTFGSTGPAMAEQLRRWLLLGQLTRTVVIFPLVSITVGLCCFVAVATMASTPQPALRCIGAVTLVFAAGAIVRLALGVFVSATAADWRLPPQDRAVTSLALFVTPHATARLAGCLARSTDILAGWQSWALAAIFAGIGRIALRKTVILAVVAFAIDILVNARLMCR